MKSLLLLVVWLSSNGLWAALPKPRNEALPEFRLTAVTGGKAGLVTRKDFQGKIWIANFMFTRCTGPCPLNSARMQVLQRELPREILLASFTVDPKRDQLQALSRYARRFRAQAGRWLFLTAPDEETLIPLFKDSFRTAYKVNPSSPCGYETWHSSKFFLIDPAGVIRGEYALEDPEQFKRIRSDALTLWQASRNQT